MRTNIEIDDAVLGKAMELSGLRTKRETVAAALKAFVQIESELKLRDLFGKLHWEGDLEAMRLD